MAAKTKSNKIEITRIYDAPLKLVWAAWTEPEQVKHWWGPRGFTLTTHNHDLRTGGSWTYTMHGPDGTNYENKTKYLEVEKYSRLVYDHGGNEDQDRPPLFRVTALFTETNGKTKLEMCMAFATPEVAEETRKFIKKAGGEGTWDRLAEYVEKQQTGKEKFVINRSFDAPIDLMYKLWTDPDHLSKWIPPTGMTMEFIKADIRPGGSTFSKMTNGTNLTMYAKANYLEMTKPNRIVYTQQFAEEDGRTSRHPMAPTWPETMLTIVTLAAEGPDQTRVTITWEPVDNFTKDELETFIAGRAGMTQGWGGSFDKLESYLDQM